MFRCVVKRLILLLLIISVVFTSNYCNSKREPRNLIRGTVTDSATGTPIDSAQIVIIDTISLSRVFYADHLGNYQANPDTTGIVQVFCRKEEYITKMTTVDLTTNKDIYGNINFELIKQ